MERFIECCFQFPRYLRYRSVALSLLHTHTQSSVTAGHGNGEPETGTKRAGIAVVEPDWPARFWGANFQKFKVRHFTHHPQKTRRQHTWRARPRLVVYVTSSESLPVGRVSARRGNIRLVFGGSSASAGSAIGQCDLSSVSQSASQLNNCRIAFPVSPILTILSAACVRVTGAFCLSLLATALTAVMMRPSTLDIRTNYHDGCYTFMR